MRGVTERVRPLPVEHHDDPVFEELQRVRRRGRQHLAITAVAAPVLFCVAFFLGRMHAEPLAPQLIAPPIIVSSEPVVREPPIIVVENPNPIAVQPAVQAKPEPKPAVEPEKPRDPALARQLVAAGNSHLEAGQLADARAEFERAFAADSGTHAALAGLAEVAYNESDYPRAVLAAKRAIALAPSAGGYRMLLGKSYYKLLRYDDAIAQWQKALDLDPANSAAQNNIEMAHRRMGR